MVGVAFQNLPHAENIGYIIPTPVVKLFLAEVARWVGQGRHVQDMRSCDCVGRRACTCSFSTSACTDNWLALQTASSDGQLAA